MIRNAAHQLCVDWLNTYNPPGHTLYDPVPVLAAAVLGALLEGMSFTLDKTHDVWDVEVTPSHTLAARGEDWAVYVARSALDLHVAAPFVGRPTWAKFRFSIHPQYH
jgi:hypothetical protein